MGSSSGDRTKNVLERKGELSSDWRWGERHQQRTNERGWENGSLFLPRLNFKFDSCPSRRFPLFREKWEKDDEESLKRIELFFILTFYLLWLFFSAFCKLFVHWKKVKWDMKGFKHEREDDESHLWQVLEVMYRFYSFHPLDIVIGTR